MRGGPGHGGPGSRDDGGGFGVRRPLRFLAFKLGLDEKQIESLARILDELKTERAQAAVDDRRSQAELADAIAGETFNAAAVASAGDRRAATADEVAEEDAVAKATDAEFMLGC